MQYEGVVFLMTDLRGRSLFQARLMQYEGVVFLMTDLRGRSCVKPRQMQYEGVIFFDGGSQRKGLCGLGAGVMFAVKAGTLDQGFPTPKSIPGKIGTIYRTEHQC
jgi:hypothetical protein